MRNKILFLIICVIFLSLMPILHTYIQTGKLWAGVAPQFVDDDLYYYARMQNIMHGHPLIGNPYFLEHRREISPAFFLSDWLAAAPMVIGMPFVAAVAFNFIIWSIIFSLLAYALFREYTLSKSTAVIGSFLTYMTFYALILRPVAMQIVAPFFLFFCIAYARWLKAEIPSRSQNLFLVVSTALSFYIYAYLWQIVVVVLGLTALFLTYRKEWLRLKHLIFVVSSSCVLGLPMVLCALKQISHPYYWQSMMRIGLVNTHLPTALSMYDGLMIGVILLLWYISFQWIRSLRKNKTYISALTFTFLMGLALIIVSMSNVITGKELEISNHIERFAIIWISIVYVMCVWFLMQFRFETRAISYFRKIVLSLLLILSSGIFAYFFIHGFSMQSVLKTDTVSAQAYAAPLDWLNKNWTGESVVWSNGLIGCYVPIMTTGFQLFNAFGGLHLVPSKEVEERYLVSHYFDNLTLQDIERDFRQYAGTGNAIHQYKTYNRKVKLCRLLGFSYLGIDCGQTTDAISFKGEKYFMDLYAQYKNDIKPNIKDELKKFNVTYIIKDKNQEETFMPASILGTKRVWNDDRFEIYSITYNAS